MKLTPEDKDHLTQIRETLAQCKQFGWDVDMFTTSDVELLLRLTDQPGSPQWEQECEEFGCHDEAQAGGSKCGPVDRQSPADPHNQGFDDTTT